MPKLLPDQNFYLSRGTRALGGLTLMLVGILAWVHAAPAAQAPPSGSNSAATITGAFADSCRDFAAHSSKDISYVELHYVAGPVVRDESINSPDHAIDGGAGDEIAFTTVKSGTTIEEFACVPSNRAPTARLEIQTPPIDQTLEHCYDFSWGGSPGDTLVCQQSSPRSVWTSASEISGNNGSRIFFGWGCGAFTSSCPWTFSLRGIGSSDPDGDIASWSLDFGDGTSASGSWSTAPPTEIAHVYTRDASGSINCRGVVGFVSGVCVVTLTVTDSAGQSDSDAILMVFIDQHPN
jgi:hypothetical protein